MEQAIRRIACLSFRRIICIAAMILLALCLCQFVIHYAGYNTN